LIVANVTKKTRKAIEALAAEHGLLVPASGAASQRHRVRGAAHLRPRARRSERYLPDLVTALDRRLSAHGLGADDIVIRMTGCPNGCARPYLAEVGLVGKGPGRYNLYLGAAFDDRGYPSSMLKIFEHDAIVNALDPLFAATLPTATPEERFGDFVIRAGSSPRPPTAETSMPRRTNTVQLEVGPSQIGTRVTARTLPLPACTRNRVHPISGFIESVESETSDFD